MKPAGCTHRAVAAGEACRVDACDHGTVHVTLGALTLRLSRAQLLDLAATLRAAAERLDEARPADWLC